jgi:hypothetical protein
MPLLGLPKDFKHKLFFSNCVPLTFITPNASSSQGFRAITDDCVIFYSTQIKFDIDNNKKQKIYEMKHHFQDTWVAKLP